jgi:hypothetical protein
MNESSGSMKGIEGGDFRAKGSEDSIVGMDDNK